VSERLFELTGIRYIEGYGLTETMAPSHVNPRERPKLGCLGKPLPGVDARIIDPDTCEPLRDECPGELVVSGPQVFVGYWNDPEATRQAFVEIDGKRSFRTGDIARRDAEGYYFMTDRLKRMINASGMKVWPAEVEAVLYGHPAIQEACVIAAHDSYRGETVKALVSLKPDMRDRVSAGEIMAWCRERIAAYKAPRLVEFVEALPKSATGKVQWRMLQEESMRNSSR
jgi:fatty-acyl-CoA synthase